MVKFARSMLPALGAIAVIGLASVPGTAHAWWRGGPYVGFAVIPPPVIFAPPPPIYYAPPPPAYYAPPAPTYYTPAQSGQGCYAGPYVCPLEHASPMGSPCSCPANNGRVAGQVN